MVTIKKKGIGRRETKQWPWLWNWTWISQQAENSTISQLTSGNRKGHMSLVILQSERDGLFHYYMLKARIRRCDPAETHVQLINKSASTQNRQQLLLQSQIKAKQEGQNGAAVRIMIRLCVNGRSLHPTTGGSQNFALHSNHLMTLQQKQ